MLRNTPKHQFSSNGVEGILHNFGCEIVHLGSNITCATFMCQMLAKCSETLQISFWFQWSRMDASQLRYTEIVHSGPKLKFRMFLCVEG
jgi:hypothetical protein